MSNNKIGSRPARAWRLLVCSLALVAIVAAPTACSSSDEGQNWWDDRDITFQDQLKTQESTLALLRTAILEHDLWTKESWSRVEVVSSRQVSEYDVDWPGQRLDRLPVLIEQISTIDSYRFGLGAEDKLDYGHLVVNRMAFVSQNLLEASWLMVDVIGRDELRREDVTAINQKLDQAFRGLEPALPPPE